MKGKRKIKNAKWILLIQIQAEARRIYAKRSKRASNRFLDSVSLLVMDGEPSGRLAGGAGPTATKASIN